MRAVWLWVIAAAVLLALDGSGVSRPELAWLGVIGVAGTAFVVGVVVWTCRVTRYVITDRRVAMAIGLALQGEANIPFPRLRNAAVRRFDDGTGDIALQPDGSLGVGYAILWPHVRPWKLARPEPTLRAVPDVDQVATTLTEAMKEAGVAAGGDDEGRATRSPRVPTVADTLEGAA